MKGIINKGIQEMIEAKYGEEEWRKVKSIAGCEEPFFAASLDYPDDMTLALVKAASMVSGFDVETLLIKYGKFMVPNTLKRNYPTYFTLAGSSSRDFLLSMNRVHDTATRSIPHAAPPRFDCEELPDGRLLMHYQSSRKLCSVLQGLILGVGINFGESLQVREVACMHKGDSRCTMEVTFQ